MILFKIESVREMLSAKIHQTFIAFNQICFNNFPVIVPIHINLTKKRIRHISRSHIRNHIIFSKQHNSSKIKTRYSCYAVHTVQPRTFQELFI